MIEQYPGPPGGTDLERGRCLELRELIALPETAQKILESQRR